MRAVVLSVAAVLMVACGGGSNDDGLELDASGQPVRQCSAMQGIYRVKIQDVVGDTKACPADAFEAAIGFGSYAGQLSQVSYSADGCQATVHTTFSGWTYSYDLQVEPDGQSAHGLGNLRVGTRCAVQFKATVAEQVQAL